MIGGVEEEEDQGGEECERKGYERRRRKRGCICDDGEGGKQAAVSEGYSKALVLVSGRWAGGSWLPGAGRDDENSEAPLGEDGVEGVGGGHPEDCLWGH